MQIKHKSFFKNPDSDKTWFESWVKRLESLNGREYTRSEIQTSLGKTCIWGLHAEMIEREPLVIFPGARTTALFWDFDKGLDHLGNQFRIYLVETNGLPNLSDGATPDIRSTGYGVWATEVLDRLHIDKCYIAGASFGGSICMKLAIVSPSRIKAAFLLNPGCLQSFSLSLKNLYFNLLPIISPTRGNVLRFLEKAVFCKPHHMLSPNAEELIIDYEIFALTRYKDNTQKPYDMGDELRQAHVDTYLLEGDRDLLFPFAKSVRNARARIPRLIDVCVFQHVGHGIETYRPALEYIRKIMVSGSGAVSHHHSS